MSRRSSYTLTCGNANTINSFAQKEINMADAPEIPEAKDPFERRVAVCIAVLAALLAFVSMRGDNAKTDAGLRTTEASNQWSFFQAKAIREHTLNIEINLLDAISPSALNVDVAATLKAKAGEEIGRYKTERDEIKTKAEALSKDAGTFSAINDRCDLGALFMQIAIVILSAAILSRMNLMFYTGAALGAAGAITGLSSLLL